MHLQISIVLTKMQLHHSTCVCTKSVNSSLPMSWKSSFAYILTSGMPMRDYLALSRARKFIIRVIESTQRAGMDCAGQDTVRPRRTLTLALAGGSMRPRPWGFFCHAPRTMRRIVLKFCTAYGASFAQFLVNKFWLGHVRSRNYDVTRGTRSGNFCEK